MTYISWHFARLFAVRVSCDFFAASDLPYSSFFALRVFAAFVFKTDRFLKQSFA